MTAVASLGQGRDGGPACSGRRGRSTPYGVAVTTRSTVSISGNDRLSESFACHSIGWTVWMRDRRVRLAAR